MVPPLAIALGIKGLGAIAAAATGGGSLALRTARARAWASVAALVLTPALVLGELWHSAQIEDLRAHFGLAAVAIVLAAVLIGTLAYAIGRRPFLLPLLAAFTLPFRIPVESGSTSANLLVPLYIVIAAGVLAHAWHVLRPRPPAEGNGSGHIGAWREFAPTRIDYVLVVVIVLYALQSLYSSDFEQALKSLAFYYVPFALLFKLLTSVRWSRRLFVACFGILVGLGLVFAGIGFVEYATRHVLWNQKVIQANEFQSYFRVNSLFFDPSIYGRFLAIVMIGLATTLLWPRARREIVIAALALVVLWGGIVLSFSQSSFGALLVGLVVLAGLRWDPRPVIFGGAVALVLAIGVVVAAPGAVNLNLGSSSSVNKASSGRFKLVSGGLALFSERPFWGYGSGSFAQRVPLEGGGLLDRRRLRVAHDSAHRRRRAGRDRARPVPASDRDRRGAAFPCARGPSRTRPSPLRARRARLHRGRVRRALRAHAALRGVPRGSDNLGPVGACCGVAARRRPRVRRARGCAVGGGGILEQDVSVPHGKMTEPTENRTPRP